MPGTRLSFWLRRLLYWQGTIVAEKPVIFLLGPLVLTTVLSYGFVFQHKLSTNQNIRELYIPVQGPSAAAQALIKAEFNDTFGSNLDVMSGLTFSVILLPTRLGTILDEDFVTQYVWLRQSLEGILVQLEHDWVTYASLCAKQPAWDYQCAPDIFSLLTLQGIPGYRDIRFLKYPISEVLLPSNVTTVMQLYNCLGGVRADSQGYILDAKAAMMSFHFPHPGGNHHLREAIHAWEHAMLWHLANWSPVSLELSWFTLRNFDSELEFSHQLVGLFPHLLGVVLVISILACCVADWVASKPWLAVGGVVTALLAVASGFGCLLIMQVRFVNIVYIAPFMIVSIGVDDAFLMLAAWRRSWLITDVKPRIAETLSDAAMSITVTSLTDILSFGVGAFSVFPAVKYFCIYTAVSLVFCYLYQITFFGACLTYSGMRETDSRHCITMAKTVPAQEAGSKGFWFRLFCTGGNQTRPLDKGQKTNSSIIESAQNPSSVPFSTIKSTDNVAAFPESLNSTDFERATVQIASPKNAAPTHPWLTIFCYQYYAPFLQQRCCQIVIGLSYILYLALAVVGWTQLRVGLDYSKLLPDNAVSKLFLNRVNEHFTDYAADLEVAIHRPADYTDSQVQSDLLRFVEQFQWTHYTSTSQFWLKEYLEYLRETGRPGAHTPEFESVLYNDFLKSPRFKVYADHILWHGNPPKIGSTRFFVSVRDLHHGEELAFRDSIYEVVHVNSEHLKRHTSFNVSVYHKSFHLAEQQAAVVPSTVKTVATATVCMMVIVFAFIPNIICSVCVALAILSINVGVIGLMSLIKIHLDIISMITILMSVGISVDFIAHISYHFVTNLHPLGQQDSRSQEVLKYLGPPILQGALSSIFGMLVLLAIPAYVVRAFVLTMLLVILSGTYHGLVLLPIVLSLFINKTKEATPGCKPFTTTASNSFQPDAMSGIQNSNTAVCTISGQVVYSQPSRNGALAVYPTPQNSTTFPGISQQGCFMLNQGRLAYFMTSFPAPPPPSGGEESPCSSSTYSLPRSSPSYKRPPESYTSDSTLQGTCSLYGSMDWAKQSMSINSKDSTKETTKSGTSSDKSAKTASTAQIDHILSMVEFKQVKAK